MSINVVNRHGERAALELQTISERLRMLASMMPRLSISTDTIAVKTVAALVDGIKTSEIDRISANICASMIIEDPEYDTLAARIVINDLHKNTTGDLVKYATDLLSYDYRGTVIKILHPRVASFITRNIRDLECAINYDNDYSNNFFGAVTLIKSYLLSYKYDNDVKITKERPQQMYMRVAIGINLNAIDDDGRATKETLMSVIDTYRLLSERYYTHATPTLFNAGTVNHTLSSCYLLSIDDSLDNIYSRLTDISKISKFSGGVGVHMSQVRASGSVIASTIGRSEGLVPLMRVFNESTRYVSQGGGKRRGSTAVYLEPWHADIEEALLSQKQQGAPERLCRDLFLALWIPDLFMTRLKRALKTKTSVMWSVMCPHECPKLTDTYGAEFEQLYLSYESQGRYRKQVDIKTLWDMIMATQIETGKPYIMYKDSVNRKCNQNNLGVIKSSNLCVAGDTLILTEDGYRPIRDLTESVARVWDTIEFTDAPVRLTGRNRKLLKVKTDDGCELQCTAYHRFPVLIGKGLDIRTYSEGVVQAGDLSPGDYLVSAEFPVVNGDDVYNIDMAYSHGFLRGVEDIKSISTIRAESIQNSARALFNEQLRLGIKDVKPPSTNGSIANRLEWLSGYFDANGYLVRTASQRSFLYANTVDEKLAMTIKFMTNTLGATAGVRAIRGSITPARVVSESDPITTVYQVRLNCTGTHKLFELGLKTKRLNYTGCAASDKSTTPPHVRVVSVEEMDGLHDTYCFRSPKTEKGIFNGIATLNCSEITIYSDTNSIGVCNLASICLPKFVIHGSGAPLFDYEKLNQVVRNVVMNMNKVMDNNKYPLEQAMNSDKLNRPIGIGVQGLSEVFMMMKLPYDSQQAMTINKLIFETMYYAALVASNERAQVCGPYPNFGSSMTSKGLLQFDLWDIVPSDMWDWVSLKQDITKSGLSNSLLIAQMPTAGTSIICGHTESIEVPQSNVFTRSTLSGRFQVINRHLVNDLKKLNLWNAAIRKKIIMNEGSVQSIEEIPRAVREIYKTIFEYKLTSMIKMDRDRGAYICQSSSSNRYLPQPDMSVLTNMHMYAWKMGLKTSSYYVRCKQLSTGTKHIPESSGTNNSLLETSLNRRNDDDDDDCMMCSA